MPERGDADNQKVSSVDGVFLFYGWKKTDFRIYPGVFMSIATTTFQELLMNLRSARTLMKSFPSTKRRTIPFWSKKREEKALLNAAWWGNINVVRELLDKGVDVNAKHRDGWTALMYAAKNGHTDIARLLLDNGADTDSRSKYKTTAVMHAAERGHFDTVNVLLDNGADVNAKAESGCTALLFAAEKGQTEIVKLLLDRGADLNARNEYGKTPLIGAIKNGHIDTLKVLLDNNADINPDGSIRSEEAALSIAELKCRFAFTTSLEKTGRPE